MPSASIFTKKRMGLDNKVWFSMMTIVILSIGLFGYNLKSGGEKKPCRLITIYVNGRAESDNVFFTAGQPITFRSPISPGDEVSWDFGDNSKNGEGFSAVHSFKDDGSYKIIATVNGRCSYEKNIRIRKPEPAIRDSLGNITESIIGLDQGFVGDNFVFSTPLHANNYEWYIENNNSYPKKTGDTVSYKFRSEGKYILVLMLDQDRSKKYSKDITIAPIVKSDGGLIIPKILIPKEKPRDTIVHAPPIDTGKLGKVPPKKFVSLTNEQFVLYMQYVVCGTMAAKDFNSYLCQGENTPVISNGKGGKTFGALCAELLGKKIEIESVIVTRENEDCAVLLTVKWDKKGRLAKNPCHRD
jgi:hypothetical protein